MKRAYEIKAYELPDAIAWQEGMMLAPQHFQQLTRRQEQLLHFHALSIAPYHWGLRTLSFDKALLNGGTLRVSTLEAVMPDGTVVCYQGSEGGAVLEKKLPEVQGVITIHLAIARRSSAHQAFNGSLERYDSFEGPEVVDEATGRQSIGIRRNRPRLYLLFEDELTDKYVSLPLTRLEYVNTGFKRTDYVPPSLFIDGQTSPAAALGRLCEEISKTLREKASFLANELDSPAMLSDVRALIKRHQIHSIVAALIQFEAILYADKPHPFLVYLALCNLAGHTATLSNELVPSPFDPYNHNDLLGTFRQIDLYIRKAIQEGIVQTYKEHVFTPGGQGFRIGFDASWFGYKLVLGVRVRAGMSEADTVAWLEESLICSRRHLDRARKLRVLGVERKRIDASDDVKPMRGMVLFEIDADPAFIDADEPLFVQRPDESTSQARPAEIVLYVQTKKESQS